ncbi:MAG: bifunctional nuclease family protein [bacterium]
MQLMKVSGIGIDPKTNMPVVLLKDIDNTQLLPIWIGMFEANAIAMEVEKTSSPRPFTHDLIKNILNTTHILCEKVIISEIKDTIYYAKIILKFGNNLFEIDSRPSDAIAIALKLNAPIYVEEEVLKTAVEIIKPLDEQEAKKLKNILKTIKPEDFANNG